ncbi:MAG TPA: Maf family protein [Pyrinomonadaceae bacterium]|nr:Maf family protein [Pyrinomonadaceae bacterium]
MINDKSSMLQLPKIILASGSPRRAEILRFVGWEFEKHVADVDETEFAGEKPEDYVRRLAKTKAETVAANYENALVLGADTIVVIDEQIVGKPKDLTDARRMLRLLSGRRHEVLTGVALVSCQPSAVSRQQIQDQKPKIEDQTANPKSEIRNPKSLVDLQKTRVKFAELSDAEIELLIEKGEPLDKAGAYAVQAQAALFIEEIRGDYWNVVGLPVNLVYRMWKTFAADR